LNGKCEEFRWFLWKLQGILGRKISGIFNYAGVQGKNNAYHNANKVQNQGIYV
jgi:hypothetical protein